MRAFRIGDTFEHAIATGVTRCLRCGLPFCPIFQCEVLRAIRFEACKDLDKTHADPTIDETFEQQEFRKG
jgi:hypothetical protein